MKQIVQNYNSGELKLEDVPAPVCRRGGVLVRTAYSLVSSGTERMKVSQARMGLIAKAKARPDKVKQVIQSIHQTGLLETYRKVRERLDALTPLGYSLAGVVEEVGGGLDELHVGQAVACAGEGIACHAEYVFVPRNLCVPVPEGVELKDAAFATVGAIAMQGVRQANVTLGDSVVVIGLGLVGLLAVQMLKATGCRVIGVDVDPAKVDLARKCGADLALERSAPGLEEAIEQFTQGIGVDAAYIAASANTSDPMALAGEIVRDRGSVVIVGMVKVEADWRLYYHKELSVVMSRSYGPGRYDRNYENKGIDYPIGYIPWTQRRNLAEFLRLIQAGSVRPSELGPEVYKLADAPQAYDKLNAGGPDAPIAFLFEYPERNEPTRKVMLPAATKPAPSGATVGYGMIGAGNFATGTLIPALKRIDAARLVALCSAGGLSARSAGERHGFAYCASDYQELLRDESIDAVVIATHHDTHARFTCDALRAGKHVFVEKPLALDREQLKAVVTAQRESGRLLMPGFNRRFSPLSEAIHSAFKNREGPIEIQCRVNAGVIKADSWYQDSEEGGWRIVSEGCHWLDLIQYLCDSHAVRVYAEMVGGSAAGRQNDNMIVTLRMADGSIATLMYVANGDAHFDKERIEVFGQGAVGVIDNWHRAIISRDGKKQVVKPARPGKGHFEELHAFTHAVRRAEAAPIALESAIATTLASFGAAEAATNGAPIQIDVQAFLATSEKNEQPREAAAL